MKKIFTFTFTSTLIACIAAFAHAQELNKLEPSGPLNIRNQMPLYLFYMAPTPDRAKTLGRGKIEIDTSYHVSNVIVQQRPWPAIHFKPIDGEIEGQKNREWYVYTDMEVNRLDANISYGLLENLQLSLDIPYFRFSRGCLDGFIESFESAFSFIKTPNAREERPSYGYEYEFRNRGKPIINDTLKPNGLGEITTYLKWQAMKEDKLWPALSLRTEVKFPTATDNLLGSGKFDYGLSLLLDKKIFDKLSIYANIGYLRIEKPDIMSNLYGFNNDMWHGMLAFEYFLTNKTAMLLQATANTTAYDYDGMSSNGGVTSTGRDPVVLTLGFNHNFNNNISWQIAVDENTNTAAPDFGVYTGFKIKL